MRGTVRGDRDGVDEMGLVGEIILPFTPASKAAFRTLKVCSSGSWLVGNVNPVFDHISFFRELVFLVE